MPPPLDDARTHQDCVLPLLQEDKKLGATAAWEKKTDSWIEQNKLQQRFAALKAQADAGLAARQDKLAQKLHAEEQALKQELISCQESPAQRRAQMAARAHELARRREAERQQLAAALMDQAFRDNCDPLRERNSKHLVYRTAQEREQQVSGAHCCCGHQPAGAASRRSQHRALLRL